MVMQEKYNKINRCPMRYVYDDRIHGAINDATFKLLFKRKDLLEYLSEFTGEKVRNIISMMRKMDSRYVASYPIFETIIEKNEFQENHDAEFWFIDGRKIKGHISGTGNTKMIKNHVKVSFRVLYMIFN